MNPKSINAFLLVVLLSAGCAPITYMEPSGPGTQYDSACGNGIMDTMTIQLPEFDATVFVSTAIQAESGWLQLNFVSLRDLDLKILSSDVQVHSRRFRMMSTSAHIAYAGRGFPRLPISGERQTTLDEQPIVGATFRAFGDLNFTLVFEIPVSNLPADMTFPHVALGGKVVSVAPIRLERKDKLRLGLCGV